MSTERRFKLDKKRKNDEDLLITGNVTEKGGKIDRKFSKRGSM